MRPLDGLSQARRDATGPTSGSFDGAAETSSAKSKLYYVNEKLVGIVGRSCAYVVGVIVI
jgi:hypothetical protein